MSGILTEASDFRSEMHRPTSFRPTFFVMATSSRRASAGEFSAREPWVRRCASRPIALPTPPRPSAAVIWVSDWMSRKQAHLLKVAAASASKPGDAERR